MNAERIAFLRKLYEHHADFETIDDAIDNDLTAGELRELLDLNERAHAGERLYVWFTKGGKYIISAYRQLPVLGPRQIQKGEAIVQGLFIPDKTP